MTVAVSMKLTGHNVDATKRLGQFLKTSSPHVKSFWNAMKGIVWKSTGSHIRNNKGPTSDWKPMHAVTKILRVHGGDKLLQDNGTLINSVTSMAQGTYLTQSITRMEIGTNLKNPKTGVCFPRVLAEGAKVPVSGKMVVYMFHRGINYFGKDFVEIPARPFIYVDRMMQEDARQLVKRTIDGVALNKSSMVTENIPV